MLILGGALAGPAWAHYRTLGAADVDNFITALGDGKRIYTEVHRLIIRLRLVIDTLTPS